MSANNDQYFQNPLIHRDRTRQTGSDWSRSFDCTDMAPLIICRGPIRKEAMDVFAEMGIEHFGILLSEKDSITYNNALAPELRVLTDQGRVHRVQDYSGADRAERGERINEIIQLAHDNGYNSIFAGYGFMAEDEEMVAAMEAAGLTFIGPGSTTVHNAGLKDEAKRIATSVGVSVTPGIDNAATLTVLSKFADSEALLAISREQELSIDLDLLDTDLSLEAKAEAVLGASLDKGIDLFSIAEFGAVLAEQVAGMYTKWPANRIRLKAISGGGGKGQRILPALASLDGNVEEQTAHATALVPGLVREILNEVKCAGVGDNKNVLCELNIETTRHQEIQVIGNGEWCVSLGGRDCSLQMHEQKLLELSVTAEAIELEIEAAVVADNTPHVTALQKDLRVLNAMEDEATKFGRAVGLDSLSTFECIVDGDNHFFMEMNTRIQVEHRVSELCYRLVFTNPDDDSDSFAVDSLVEMMVLLASHRTRLPEPTRHRRNMAAVEARINATNDALQPHAGGLIEDWSGSSAGEIRDDQGISVPNPDTGAFISYRLAGAYDSNIALLLTTGDSRRHSFANMSEVIRQTTLRGEDLATNLHFHAGLVQWFLGNGVNARPTTQFVADYLAAVGQLKVAAGQLSVVDLFAGIRRRLLSNAAESVQSDYGIAIDAKRSLLVTLVQALLDQPHLLSGWLSANRMSYQIGSDQGVLWLKNPIEVALDSYQFLDQAYEAGRPANEMIWTEDNDLLQRAMAFYRTLGEQLGSQHEQSDFVALDQALAAPSNAAFDEGAWAEIQAAHVGFQAGMELLSALVYVAQQGSFLGMKVEDDLSITVPDVLKDTDLHKAMGRVLAPPPVASGNEILALSGGMFYAREAPGMDPFVVKGGHFEKGDALYIVEVMKMFTTVRATFAGTIESVLVTTDGEIVKKGQPLFDITPDEVVLAADPAEEKASRQRATADFLSWLGGEG